MEGVREQVVAQQHGRLIPPLGIDRGRMPADQRLVEDIVMNEGRGVDHLDDRREHRVRRAQARRRPGRSTTTEGRAGPFPGNRHCDRRGFCTNGNRLASSASKIRSACSSSGGDGRVRAAASFRVISSGIQQRLRGHPRPPESSVTIKGATGRPRIRSRTYQSRSHAPRFALPTTFFRPEGPPGPQPGVKPRESPQQRVYQALCGLEGRRTPCPAGGVVRDPAALQAGIRVAPPIPGFHPGPGPAALRARKNVVGNAERSAWERGF